MAAPLAEPPSDGAITRVNFGFEWDLGAGPLAPGRYWFEVTNDGTVEHEFEVASIPPGTTSEEALAALSWPEGTPVPAGQLDLTRPTLIASPSMIGGIGLLSPDATAWFALNLEPGTYLAFCPI